MLTPDQREALGRKVREVWVAWAKTQPDPKPSWLKPWEELSEPDREVDRQIGEALFTMGEEAMGRVLAKEIRELARGVTDTVTSNPGHVVIIEPGSLVDTLHSIAERCETTEAQREAARVRRDAINRVIKGSSFYFVTSILSRGKAGG